MPSRPVDAAPARNRHTPASPAPAAASHGARISFNRLPGSPASPPSQQLATGIASQRPPGLLRAARRRMPELLAGKHT